MNPIVIGLDLSLTSTGIAGGGWTRRILSNRGDTDLQRIQYIAKEICEYARIADLMVVEGISYGSHGSGKFSARAGLFWLVLDRLDRHETPVAVVPPKVRAKYASGNGAAGKDEVLIAMMKRFSQIEFSGNDEADALALAAMGFDHLGHPLATLPKAHRIALDKVQWPDS